MGSAGGSTGVVLVPTADAVPVGAVMIGNALNGFCRPSVVGGTMTIGPSGYSCWNDGFFDTSTRGSNRTLPRVGGASGTDNGARLVVMNQYVKPTTASAPMIMRMREKMEGVVMVLVLRAGRTHTHAP